MSPILWLAMLAACDNTFDYAVGWGATYTTRCAARMAVRGDAFEALCEPPPCAEGFESVAVSHAVVALDPGVKVLGNAERTCVQDASRLVENAGLSVNGERIEPAAPPEPAAPAAP